MTNFIPKKTKYKKEQKKIQFKRIRKPYSLNNIFFGQIGLKATSFGILTQKQIEMLKNTINKYIKKTGKLKINIFAFSPLTKKPLEVRMGKGKGAVNSWIAKIRSGTMICEIKTNKYTTAIKALSSVKYKLPFKSKILIENIYV